MLMIDADALASRFDALAHDDWNQGTSVSWADAFKVSAEMVRDERVVDAEPIKHGMWINDKGIYKCTACNDLCLVAGWANCIPEKQMYKVFKFCPNCGAKMDEVTE